MKKLLTLVIVMAAFSAASYAQVTATAATNATIITPIAIAWAQDLNFGNVAVSATDGTVTVPAVAGIPTRTFTGGVTLPAVTGTVTAAQFDVTGSGSSTYVISLPPSFITVTDGGTNTMTVDTWLSDQPSDVGTLVTGAQSFYVGATLNVTGGQAAGTYTNASDLSVTINYN
jgi:hypothetical protein